MFKNKITKEELPEYKIHHFKGEIFVVKNMNDAQKATDILKKQDIIGFDTETRPSFKKGRINQVALLQLSTSDQAFLFRLKHISLPLSVLEILSNESIIKVGAAIRDDLKVLKKIKNFEPQGFIDLQTYVKKFEIESFSLRKLSAIVLGYRISKSQQLSNWDAPRYSRGQKVYAATDAWVSLEIFKKLKDSL